MEDTGNVNGLESCNDGSKAREQQLARLDEDRGGAIGKRLKEESLTTVQGKANDAYAARPPSLDLHLALMS